MRYYGKIQSKLPIFRVKSVKIYTGQKNLHGHVRGDRDKYQECKKNLAERGQHEKLSIHVGKFPGGNDCFYNNK